MSKQKVVTPRTRLCGPTASSRANHATTWARPACVTITPLGCPVEPDVYSTYASPPPRLRCRRAAASAAGLSAPRPRCRSGGRCSTREITPSSVSTPSGKIADESTTSAGGNCTPIAVACSKHAASVSSTAHRACVSMCPCRSGGNAGSTGTYAAPTLSTARKDATTPTPRPIITATNGVFMASCDASTCSMAHASSSAIAAATASRTANVNDCPSSNTRATLRGCCCTARSNASTTLLVLPARWSILGVNNSTINNQLGLTLR